MSTLPMAAMAAAPLALASGAPRARASQPSRPAAAFAVPHATILAPRRNSFLGSPALSASRRAAPQAQITRAASASGDFKIDDWTQVTQPWLNEKRVPTITPGKILGLAKGGEVAILDVRMAEGWEDVRVDVPDVANVPLYRDLQISDAKSFMKRVVYLTNGMKGTEVNPDFPALVATALPDKDAPIAVICDAGGSYFGSPNFVKGKMSRSWHAVYAMMAKLGYTNVVHVEGGLRQWCGEGLPVVGKDIESWKKKAAMLP